MPTSLHATNRPSRSSSQLVSPHKKRCKNSHPQRTAPTKTPTPQKQSRSLPVPGTTKTPSAIPSKPPNTPPTSSSRPTYASAPPTRSVLETRLRRIRTGRSPFETRSRAGRGRGTRRSSRRTRCRRLGRRRRRGRGCRGVVSGGDVRVRIGRWMMGRLGEVGSGGLWCRGRRRGRGWR